MKIYTFHKQNLFFIERSVADGKACEESRKAVRSHLNRKSIRGSTFFEGSDFEKKYVSAEVLNSAIRLEC